MGVQAAPRRTKPVAQTKSQSDPAQTGVAFGGVVQTAQPEPHANVPELHEKPHVCPLHVAVEFAGGTHAVHEVPHVATAVSETHWLPHR